MQIEFALRGDVELKNLDKLLGTLTAQRAKRTVRSALKYAVRDMVKEIKKNVPVRTGKLKKNIKSGIKKRTPHNTEAIWVGPHKKAFYGYYLEHGTSKIPGMHFIKKAYKNNKDAIIQRFKDKFREMVHKNVKAMTMRERLTGKK